MHMDGYGMKIARTTGIWSIELMDGWGLIFFFIVALLILGVTSWLAIYFMWSNDVTCLSGVCWVYVARCLCL